jgi:uncharacterized protein
MITFRPHHFLCTLCFQGKGYSAHFVANYKKIVQQLRNENGYDTPIKVVRETDSICTACPHSRGTKCNTEETIVPLDDAHAEALGLKEGDVLSWGEAKELIRENIDLSKFKTICATCSWQSLGICEIALSKFIREH